MILVKLKKENLLLMNFLLQTILKETVLITNVRPACGCTAANYTKTPIKPGEKEWLLQLLMLQMLVYFKICYHYN